MQPDVTTIVVLFLVALGAGTVDAIAGGGGLITLPALLAAGLAPHAALATNKGQAVFGALAASVAYVRARNVDRGMAVFTFPAGFLGSLLGASLVLALSPAALRPVVLVLLGGVAVLVAVRRPGRESSEPERTGGGARAAAAAIALVVGAYDGFFGPGTGTFLIMGFVLALRAPMTRAAGDARIVNLASNLAAFVLFARRGAIVWPLALPMAAAQFVGGALGARIAVRGGARVVRMAVLVISCSLLVKLAWDLYRGG